MTIYMGAALVVAVGAQLVLLRLVLRQQRATERLEDRLGQLLVGISLLTDTTEGGLHDVALEIGRVSATAALKPKARAAATRRINGAARRGRSVRDIAAAEQLSEGEVRLRLKLADVSPGQVNHASMR